MTRFQEELSRALCILEAERREVLVKRLQDAFKSAFARLKYIDGQIIVPDEVYATIKASHAAIHTMLGKILDNQGEDKMLKQLRLLNDALLKTWTSASTAKPVNLFDAKNPALISAITQALDEWYTVGQKAIKQIDATYVRRFKDWSDAVKDTQLLYVTLALLYP